MENKSLSSVEENYLKAIFKLSEKTEDSVSTNAIAALMNTAAASVTDMLKRLSDKEVILYEKYRGVRLSAEGLKLATLLVRKHRLWETFMVEKLNFSWDEVHPIAEQLEHIDSIELINRLDSFLGYPKFDPHGDPIPDSEGVFSHHHQVLLSELKIGEKGVVVGVLDHSSAFLRYVDQLKLVLGTEVQLLERIEYDLSIRLLVNGDTELMVTYKVCNNLYVNPEK